LKPHNFLVDANGKLCICDFGFACREWDCPTGCAGSPEFAAPECCSFNGKITHTTKADIYSLGASLQHFLLGRLPQGPQDMPKGLSAATEDLLQEMMSPDPTDRPTIDELLEAPQLKESVFTQWLSQWHIVLQGFSGQ